MNHRERIRTFLERGYWNRQSRVLSRLGLRISPPIRSKHTLNPIVNGNADPIVVSTIHTPAPSLLKLIELLRNHVHPALMGACVFGSQADQTFTSYSDFDGILLIDLNQVGKGKKSLRSLRSTIARTEALLIEIDPLQHHSWYILFTDDHPGNPELIPTACLGSCVSLTTDFALPRIGNQLDRSDFLRYCQKQQKTLLRLNESTSLYAFKSMLSEFMLTPALYLQSTTGKPISKKDSFSIIQTLLPALDSGAMKTASEWRKNWHQPGVNNAPPQLKRKTIYAKKPLHPLCTYGIPYDEIDTWRKAAMAYLDALCATLESGFQE
jgi:hypothetical protein